jgi:hypothetical protein
MGKSSREIVLAKADFFRFGLRMNASELNRIRDAVLSLRNEVNCRIEHGAKSGGHLEYIKLRLDQMIGFETMKTNNTAADAYAEAHNRAINAFDALDDYLANQPAPDQIEDLNWGHVGDMMKLAAEIESIIPKP